jgi:hypothetical protein
VTFETPNELLLGTSNQSTIHSHINANNCKAIPTTNANKPIIFRLPKSQSNKYTSSRRQGRKTKDKSYIYSCCTSSSAHHLKCSLRYRYNRKKRIRAGYDEVAIIGLHLFVSAGYWNCFFLRQSRATNSRSDSKTGVGPNHPTEQQQQQQQ